MIMRYLVIEDGGYRIRPILQASQVLQSKGVEVLAIPTVPELFDVPAAVLASFDRVFVDFHLATDRLLTVPIHRPIRIGDAEQDVVITTGMGIILYLTDLQTRGALPAEKPQLLTFVDASEDQSRLFIGATTAWFGIPYFHVSVDAKALAADLLDPDAAVRRAKTPQLIATCERFDDLIEDRPTPTDALTRHGYTLIPEVYDALSAYLAVRGAGGGFRGFQHEILTRFGIRLGGNPTEHFAKGYMQHLYDGVRRFLHAYAPDVAQEWPDTFNIRLRSGERDHLCDFLDNTHWFWSEPDVRAALMWHRAHNPQDGEQ